MGTLIAHGRVLRSVRLSNMVNRLFYTKLGQVFISILFGISLSFLFHRACKGEQCTILEPPPNADVDGKIFRVGGKCYSYEPSIVPCMSINNNAAS